MAERRTNLHCLFGENLLENGNKKSIKSFSLEQTKGFKIEGFILIPFSLESNKYFCRPSIRRSDERKIVHIAIQETLCKMLMTKEQADTT